MRPVAVLVHDEALADEPELLEAVTAATGLAVENDRLHAELRARLEEVRASRARVIEAGQKERQRLERNLHDGAQQRLIALSLDLSLLGERLGDDADATRRLERAQGRDRDLAGRSSAPSPAAYTRPSSAVTACRSRSSRWPPPPRSPCD